MSDLKGRDMANTGKAGEFKLPVTSNAHGKWWHAAYHNITCLVGAGVLGLPLAIAHLGWAGGTVALTVSWLVSFYTLHQLAWMHEYNGKRFCRYHELACYALGDRLGNWVALPPQLVVIVGLGITYSVTGGQSLHQFWQYVCTKAQDSATNSPEHCARSFGQSAWIIVFGAVNLVLVQVPNLHALSLVSLSAAVTALTYCTIGIGGSIKAGNQEGAKYNLDGLSTAAGVFGAFAAMGTIAFSFGGHTVVLEVQATMHQSQDSNSSHPTYRNYMKGIIAAYAVLSWCFYGVAYTGFHAFGLGVKDNVIFSIEHPVWMVCLALMCIVIHVVGSYQVYTFCGLDLIELQMVKRGISNGLLARLIYRSLYVCFTTFVAVSLPFFGDLMSFVGALGMAAITFFLPPIFWLALERPKTNDWNFWASWFSIIYGVLLLFVGSIGGLRGIITNASNYTFYQ